MKIIELTKLIRPFCSLNLVKPTSQSTSRHSSYYSSPFLVDVGDVNVKYEVSQDPEEWKLVENVLPPTLVPDPVPKANYPSEWKPQGENVSNLPYFVSRTKNHMIPVYLLTKYQGYKRITMVKKIQGDIWLLERELREFLQSQQLSPIYFQVNELAGFIRIRGDYVNAVKYWLMQKNL